MHNSRLIDIYNDTMEKVFIAMSIALGRTPSINISDPHKPNLAYEKITPSSKPLIQLYNTDPIAKMIIEQLCENVPELSLSKFDLDVVQ